MPTNTTSLASLHASASNIRKLTYMLHGFVFALGSVVVIYAPSIVFFPPSDIAIPSAVLMIAFGLLFIFSYSLTHRASLAGIMTTLFVLALFYHWILNALAVGLILGSLLILGIIRRRISLDDLHAVSCVVSVLLVGFFFYQFLKVSVIPSIHIRPQTLPPVSGDQQEFSAGKDRPDIYYIILDGYGQAEMLQALHGYDNSNFISALQARGLVVASHSRANYPRSVLSLSSSLNMQYLDPLSTSMGDSYLWWPLTGIIHQSLVRQFVEETGYRFVSIASGWDFTNVSNPEVYEKPYSIVLKDFQKDFFMRTSLRYLGYLDQSLISFPSYDAYRRMIVFGFEALPEIASKIGSKFVFAHILAPHPPFVFDENGNPINPDYQLTLGDKPFMFKSLADYEHGYFSELAFVNRMTIKAVDAILAQSKTHPVIIIQGDHGPGMIGNYDYFNSACLYERFSILNAYYLPNATPGLIPNDISPVNTFRIVFNEYLGTDFEILPNRQYYNFDGSMYQFRDVTTQIGSTCEIPENGSP